MDGSKMQENQIVGKGRKIKYKESVEKQEGRKRQDNWRVVTGMKIGGQKKVGK